MLRNPDNEEWNIMKKAKSKAKQKRASRKHKYCPECEEEMAMSVIRKAESDRDFYWLLCPSCKSRFALTRQQYLRGKRPDISAIEPDGARTYHTNQTYKVGQLIYHNELGDVGVVINKASAPSNIDCSGSIIVSFTEIGQKRLIEGYAPA
jgi:uncharacterized protein YlaI